MTGRDGHKDVSLAYDGASIAHSIRGSSEIVLASLEAYRKARRGERVGLVVPEDEIRQTGESRGTLMLRWREEIDLACRMERAGEGLSATVAYRIEGDRLYLTMLDEAAFEERFDEI
jgi:hypothetical protein